MANHYAVLGIKRSDDAVAIKAADRARAREAHPDHGGSERTMMELLAVAGRSAEGGASGLFRSGHTT